MNFICETPRWTEIAHNNKYPVNTNSINGRWTPWAKRSNGWAIEPARRQCYSMSKAKLSIKRKLILWHNGVLSNYFVIRRMGHKLKARRRCQVHSTQPLPYTHVSMFAAHIAPCTVDYVDTDNETNNNNVLMYRHNPPSCELWLVEYSRCFIYASIMIFMIITSVRHHEFIIIAGTARSSVWTERPRQQWQMWMFRSFPFGCLCGGEMEHFNVLYPKFTEARNARSSQGSSARTRFDSHAMSLTSKSVSPNLFIPNVFSNHL